MKRYPRWLAGIGCVPPLCLALAILSLCLAVKVRYLPPGWEGGPSGIVVSTRRGDHLFSIVLPHR